MAKVFSGFKTFCINFSGKCNQICPINIQGYGSRWQGVRVRLTNSFYCCHFPFNSRYVHCKELLDFLCVTARGSALERAALCFTICDVQALFQNFQKYSFFQTLVLSFKMKFFKNCHNSKISQEYLDKWQKSWNKAQICGRNMLEEWTNTNQ